jgi:tRNA nucleotidyltransferase (CCA-adding enzyme)
MAAPERPLAQVGQLDGALAHRVAVVAQAAAVLQIETWLVGGTVRDLLLGRESPDLDFVAVGDGSALAAAVERQLGGRLLLHPAFLTADLIDAQGTHLDIATARQETYRAMAALPTVAPGTLAEDLRRRDFTINTLALPLAAAMHGGVGKAADQGAEDRASDSERADVAPLAAAGLAQPAAVDDDLSAGPSQPPAATLDLSAVVDLFGGRRDLAAGVLRVLHDRSFLDDPTRVLRGVRFEVRLGMRMTPDTEALARQALASGAFARLTGGRLRHELELLLESDDAIAGIERLADLGVLAAVHPDLTLDDAGRFRRLRDAAIEHAWYRAACGPPAPRRWLVLLMALVAGLDAPRRSEAAQRLLLAGEDLRLVAGAAGGAGISGGASAGGGVRAGSGDPLAATAARLGVGATAGEVDAALARLAPEELILLAAQAGTVARSWVRRYATELRPFQLAIGGADLVAAGAPPGPAIGAALRATRAARLDRVIGPGDELAFALKHLAEPAPKRP